MALHWVRSHLLYTPSLCCFLNSILAFLCSWSHGDATLLSVPTCHSRRPEYQQRCAMAPTRPGRGLSFNYRSIGPLSRVERWSRYLHELLSRSLCESVAGNQWTWTTRCCHGCSHFDELVQCLSHGAMGSKTSAYAAACHVNCTKDMWLLVSPPHLRRLLVSYLMCL